VVPDAAAPFVDEAKRGLAATADDVTDSPTALVAVVREGF
jgi:hypothetical protein